MSTRKEIEKMLDAELKSLKDVFGCKELSLVYAPETTKEHLYSKAGTAGEVNEMTQTIHIYVKDPVSAMHVLIHEFFEYMLEPLYGTHVDAFNIIVPRITKAIMDAYGEVFNKAHYKRKEKLIENLVQFWAMRRGYIKDEP